MKELRRHIQALDDFGIKSNQIVFVEPVGQHDQTDYKYVIRNYSSNGYQLLTLSSVISKLQKSLISFYAPEYYGQDVDLGNVVKRLQSALDIEIDAPICIRYLTDEKNNCGIVVKRPEEKTSDFLSDYLSFILQGQARNYLSTIISYCFDSPEIAEAFEKDLSSSYFTEADAPEIDKESEKPSILKRKKTSRGATHDRRIDSAPPQYSKQLADDEKSLERVIWELQNMKESDLRKIGLSVASLRFLIGLKSKATVSRMTITRHAKIILDDYNNMEIKMDDKTKALYFLYLKHPEGISIKCLPEHTEELLDLYQSLSGRDNPDAMRKTIENLADPFQNNVNISLSRIKKAFCEAFNMELAKYYYVDGERGGERKVALDRNLITWETIR